MRSAWLGKKWQPHQSGSFSDWCQDSDPAQTCHAIIDVDFFHAAIEDSMDQVVMGGCMGAQISVPRRQALPAPSADQFLIFLRVAAPALDELLRVNTEGVRRAACWFSTECLDGGHVLFFQFQQG